MDDRRKPIPQTPLSDEELAELEGLEATATKAPWWDDEDERVWRLHGTWGWTPAQGGLSPQPVNKQLIKAPKTGTTYQEYWPTRQDADLIIAMRNTLPRLIAELRERRSLADHDVTRMLIETRRELEETRRKLSRLRMGMRELLRPEEQKLVPPLDDPEDNIVADGFGGAWAKCGQDCRLQVVRPGKVQCDCDGFLD